MELRAEGAVQVPAQADAAAASVDAVGERARVGLEHGPRLALPLAARERPLEGRLAVRVPEGVRRAPVREGARDEEAARVEVLLGGLDVQAASLRRPGAALGVQAAPGLLQLPAPALLTRERRDPDLCKRTAAVRLLLLTAVQQAQRLALGRDVRELEEPGVGPPCIEGAEDGGLDIIARDE